jgi:hypothetical protein
MHSPIRRLFSCPDLAGFTQLDPGLPPMEYGGDGRTSGPFLPSLSPHAAGLTPGSLQVRLPFSFPAGSGLPLKRRGSACIPLSAGLSRNRTLPAMPVRRYVTRLHHSLYAAACGFG